ncbi:pirin family protein [soil metagenome]
MKKLIKIRRSDAPHWVGDGFPTRTVFHYGDLAKEVSPFLLMDYAGPVEFPPTTQSLGVGEHPHRGFETVTIVYSGEVEHRDSAGGGGKIGPGDIQWMTAASGLVHEEKHGREFAKNGGLFETIQLWVNLPAKDKMTKPRYQTIQDATVPRVELANGVGSVRVIAGSFSEQAGEASATGPAKTFSPINLWDVRLNAGRSVDLRAPKGYTSLVFVLDGDVKLASGETISSTELAVLDRDAEDYALLAVGRDAKILVLSGEPLNEPIAAYGPFVMNTQAEIRQAMIDYEAGKMGSF